MIRLAIVGDFDRGVTAHEGIDASLSRAQQTSWPDLSWEWWHTSLLPECPQHLTEVIGVPDGIWCAPATPYAKTEGALAAIRYARESETPFLGTCGGFQHAVLEFVRNVIGDEEAKHAELDPTASSLAITPLTCELVEVSAPIEAIAGTRFAAFYGSDGEREEYHCRYGINPAYLPRLEARGLRCGARDDRGEVRAVEHATHPFFVGTLFQPERRALRTAVGAMAAGTAPGEGGDVHPLVLQFIEAASNRRMRRMRSIPGDA
jgi:CTP synthase (UTP-ammonia lyase)